MEKQKIENKPHVNYKKESQKNEEKLIRISSKDIRGGMALYAGLTKIKGVSWSLSNAICKSLNLDKKKKIGDLTESEIKKIEEFIKNPNIPSYLKNRQNDFEIGENRHLTGTDLELRKEFDIKRLKKIKCYKGHRHVAGLPVRGQRTKSHFRSNRKKGSGVKSKNKEK